MPLKRFNAKRLRTSVERVLADRSYRDNAQRLKRAIRRAGGAIRAADLIESRLGDRTPDMVV